MSTETAEAEAARLSWKRLMEAARPNSPADEALRLILNSVLIDLVTNKMREDDEFAVVIGRRLDKMMRAICLR
jgi:hypothetical protein